MCRITLALLMGIMLVTTVASPMRAQADAAADLKSAIDELQKRSADQDASLIDKSLASAIAAPGELSAAQYQQARMLQAQRSISAMPNKTAPQKRQVFNKVRGDVIAEIGRHYLDPAEERPAARMSAYNAQLTTIRGITNSLLAKTVEEGVLKDLMADLDARYLNHHSELSEEEREDVLKMALKVGWSIRDRRRRRGFSFGIYDRLGSFGPPNSRSYIIDRARLHAAGDNVAAALKDLQTLVDNPDVDEGLKNRARYERMQLLVAGARWKEAAADAEVLDNISLSQVRKGAFRARDAAAAKREALRVRLANGVIGPTKYPDVVDGLCMEVLSVETLTAEEKAQLLTGVMLDRARLMAERYQWDAALAWGRVAYDIAPNRKVPEIVTLLQQLLANRSRTSFAKSTLALTKDAADMAAAHAFYARQAGVKKIVAASPETGKKEQRTVTLRPDMSNDGQFPKQLDGLSASYADRLAQALERIAAEHADGKTRALAHALLGQPDKAILAVGEAIAGLPLESPHLSAHVNFAARFVRAKFESVALANAFLDSQVHGPAGKDGKAGTADDKPNPLAAAAR